MSTERIDRRFASFQKQLSLCKWAKDHYLHVYGKDPLAKIMIQKLRFSPLKSALVGFLLVLATYGVGFTFHLYTGREIAGITKTRIDLVYDFLLIPVTFFFYIWISGRLPYLFLKLSQNGVNWKNGLNFNQFAAKVLNQSIYHRSVFFTSFAIALALGVLHVIQSIQGTQQWGGPGASYFVFFTIKIPVIWMLGWYMVLTIFLREIIFIWIFRRTVKIRHLSIRMKHADRCGGLKPLSDYLLHFTYYIMACGFGLCLLIIRSIKFAYFRTNFIVHLGIVVYLAVSIFFFFFPLHPLHRLVKKVKREIRGKMKNFETFFMWGFPRRTLYMYSGATLAPVVFFILIIFQIL